jgi:predicted ATPase/DNA-binding SARP family transcriptional activator
MEFLVLGPLRGAANGQLIEIRAAKQRALLGVLLVNANQVVSADRLLEEVWGNQQPTGGAKTLQYHISKLRDVLEPDRERGDQGVVVTEAGGYRLVVDAGQVDADHFETLGRKGARLLDVGDADLAHKRLVEALGLWRGGAFEDFRYDGFAQGEIARLEELRLLAIENRIAADLELGHHRDVVGELRDLTTRFPLRERLWGQLMTALYRSDQQAEALRTYQTARTVLGEELGIEPNTALQRLEEQILLHELPFEPPEVEAAPTDNLPARTSSFIGRQDDITQVEKLLDQRRLVTLTGFAGIGKTSLAIETARRMVEGHPDGVRLVELAPLTDPSSVIGEIATVFDIKAHPARPLLDVVTEELADRSLLLVVDNCEHLLAESARVIDTLLTGCPELQVLATSREPLQLTGEQILPLSPLALPPEEGVSVEEAGRIEAVQLFVDRAFQAQPGFDLDGRNVESVVAVVRRLEGIPLAIELAAARLRILSTRELLHRLDDQFTVLAARGAGRPERHRTLRAAIEWSHDLLPEREQTLLRRLAVFRGGFTLSAAEDVCSSNGVAQEEILDDIGHLVDASLLTTQQGEPRRYGMLEAVHQFAEELLEASGEGTDVRNRHANYFARLGPPVTSMGSADFEQDLDRLAAEEGNYVSAIAWAIRTGNGDQAMGLAARVRQTVVFRGKHYLFEWLPRALDVADPTPSLERVAVLLVVGGAFCRTGRRRQALPIIDEMRSAVEHLDDPVAWAYVTNLQLIYNEYDSDLRQTLKWALDVLTAGTADARRQNHLADTASMAIYVGRYDIAADTIAELESLRTSPLIPVISASLRGALALYREDLTTAHQLLTEAVAELRRRNLVEFLTWPLQNLAQVALATRNAGEAEEWAQHLISATQQTLDSRPLAAGHTHLARALLQQQRFEAACGATTEALNIAADTDDKLAMTWALATVAQIAWATSNPTDGAAFHAAAETLRNQTGYVHPAPRARELEHEYHQIREALGTDAFNEAWKTGTSLGNEELVGEARRVLSALPATPAG